jgi:plastocyanin
MQRGLAGAALIVTALALGSPGDGAVLARQIKIVASKPQPKELHVAVNAKVEFVNKDRRAHTVKSVRNAWPLITLAPHATATVKLFAPGRYEYKVDGRRKGAILVGQVIQGYTPGPGTASVDEEVRYSIRVEVAIHSKIVWATSQPSSNGTDDWRMSWVGTWLQRIKYLRVANSTSFNTASGLNGTLRFQAVEFSSTRPSNPPCAGKIDYPALRAQAFLRGDAAFVNFDTQATGTGRSTLETLMEQARNSCPVADFPVWLEEPDPVTSTGVSVDPPRSGIGPDDARFSRNGRNRFPINRILAHQGFTVDTGPHAVSPRSCGTGCTESFEGRVKFVFKALPPR